MFDKRFSAVLILLRAVFSYNEAIAYVSGYTKVLGLENDCINGSVLVYHTADLA